MKEKTASKSDSVDPQANIIPKADASSKSNVLRTINIEVDHKLKTIQLMANIFEPIGNIKAKIRQKEDMGINSQCLFYGEELLKDNKTLNDYCISTPNLILVRRPIKIDVIMFTENIPLTVEPNEIIDNIKDKIFKIKKLNVSLSYFGQLLDGHRTLFSYKIRDRAKLKVTAIDCNRGRDKNASDA